MNRHAVNHSGEHPRSAQVCVIGSGAGGSVAAAKLAEHGLDTVLVEAGEHLPASAMTQDELDMIPRLFREGGLSATRDRAISILQGRSLGGGTTHNTGLCVPIGEETWRQWERDHAVPLSYEGFRGYSERVLHAIGARVADEDEINPNNRILEEGARRAGWRAFRARHNRIRCSGCGYCTLGCAYNRKRTVVHAFLPAGSAAGLEIRAGVEVDRIVRTHGRGERRFRIEARTRDGGRFAIAAPVVVVSAGAVATPLLLEHSRLTGRRRAGARLHLHPFAPVGALFDDEVRAWRGVPQSVLIDEFARTDEPERSGSGFHLIAAAAQPAMTAAMAAAVGPAHRRILEHYPRLAAAGVLLRDSTRGTVAARFDGKPLVDYWPNAVDTRGFRRGIRALAEMFFAAGARQVVLPFVDRPLLERDEPLDCIDSFPFRPHSVTLGSVHPQGTCPMGTPETQAVTGGRGEVHGVPGLFIADASLFPTSAGVPPQVTIMALAWCIADAIAAERGRLFA